MLPNGDNNKITGNNVLSRQLGTCALILGRYAIY